MAGGRKEAPTRSVRDRARIAAGVIAAGILGPSGSALAAAGPAPATDALPQNLSPEEEAQQIAEMGDPPPDADPGDDEPPADPEETPAGVPGSSDEELAQEPDDDATSAPAPEDTPAVPQRLPAPSPPAPPPAAPPQVVAPPQGLTGTGPASSNGVKPRKGGGDRQSAPKPRPARRVAAERRVPAQNSRENLVPTGDPAGAPPTGGGNVHVVQAGESLWSIAAQLLGNHATAARIAALVDELWRLNADRIGSGDPDMIHAGDELQVP